MDYTLRCNSLKCRAPLADRAVVTTCSHIFCLPCSESLGLSTGASDGHRSCPACGNELVNPDDAVVSQLHPSEDYKTSILSGLNPTIIMECTARGLAFWNYQTTQEIHYQEYLIKSLTEKYNTLSTQMDNVIHDANNELTALRERVELEQREKQAVEKKNDELVKAFKEKSKSHSQLHRLYTNLKQQQFAGGIELAAEHDAENVVLAAAQNHGPQLHSRAGSHGSGGAGGGLRQATRAWQSQYPGLRSGLQSAHSVPLAHTPSTHRPYLPGQIGPQGASYGVDHRGTPRRAPLQNLNPNVYGNAMGNAGYGGLSAGIKAGRYHNGPQLQHNGIGIGRSPRAGVLPGR